jgi:ATP-binding cassette subfamily B multidrug efflux pump
MPDFFETDEITKGYDPRVARRILGYIRPYKALVAATALALAVSTAGELFLPVLVRSIVDEALMPAWISVDPRVSEVPEGKAVRIEPGDPSVGGRLLLHSSRLSGLRGSDRRALEATGFLENEPLYLVRVDAGDADQARVLADKAALFRIDGEYATLKVSELRALAPAEAKALRRADLSFIVSRATMLLGVLVAVLATTFAQIFASSLIGQRIMKDLRMELFRHASTRSLAFLSHQPVGRLVTRMTSDIETINQFFTDVVVAFLKDASIMAGALVVLYALDWRLALAATATLPPIVIATLISRTRVRDAFRRQRQWLSKVNAYIAERIAGIAIVQLFAREEASRREFEAHDGELMKATLSEMFVFATFRPLVDFFASVTTAAVIYYGARLLSIGTVSLGTLIAFVNLIRWFYSPIMDISEKYTLLQSAMAGGERVFKLLDEDDTIPDEPAIPMPPTIRGHIEFHKVWFAYKEGEWILKDLSFRVEPGEMVAIVGYTGAGKTTIANLITRLWDVQKGGIRIDGHALHDLPLDGLRRAVQPVLQDVFLFSGTIEENIRLGTEVSVERMRLAAKAVHADEFIEALSGGYSSTLSEGATNISQGQKQLISFARVLAHDPSVIILDEATSSVDTETERMIQRGLEALLEGRTSVVIAHRLSTIKHANRILVLAEGRIAEEGSHDELLEKRGLYWNLYRLQYGGKVEEDRAAG